MDISSISKIKNTSSLLEAFYIVEKFINIKGGLNSLIILPMFAEFKTFTNFDEICRLKNISFLSEKLKVFTDVINDEAILEIQKIFIDFLEILDC